VDIRNNSGPTQVNIDSPGSQLTVTQVIGEQPRNVDGAGEDVILAATRPNGGQQFEIEAAGGDAEAQRIATVLFNVLQRAGWRAGEFTSSGFLPSPVKGIVIAAADPKAKALVALRDALRSLGLHASLAQVSAQAVPRIYVGSR